MLLLVASVSAFSQTQISLPAGSKSYGNQLYLDPNGKIWGGTGSAKFRAIDTKERVDSLLSKKANAGLRSSLIPAGESPTFSLFNKEIQGMATDSQGNNYLIGTDALRKYNSDFTTVIATNSTPFTGVPQGKFNDGDIYDGKLYVPANVIGGGNYAILVYDLNTLERIAAYPVESPRGSITAITIEDGIAYTSGYLKANEFGRYRVSDWAFLGYTEFATPNDIDMVQGCKVVNGTLYLGTNQGLLYSVKTDGKDFRFLTRTRYVSNTYAYNGIDYYNNQLRALRDSTDLGRAKVLFFNHSEEPVLENDNSGKITVNGLSELKGNTTIGADLNIMSRSRIMFRQDKTALREDFSIQQLNREDFIRIADSTEFRGVFVYKGGKVIVGGSFMDEGNGERFQVNGGGVFTNYRVKSSSGSAYEPMITYGFSNGGASTAFAGMYATNNYLANYRAGLALYTVTAANTKLKALELNYDGSAVFNNKVTSGQYALSALNTAPASATAAGTAGEIRVTSTHIYVCTATNTWVRTPLTTW